MELTVRVMIVSSSDDIDGCVDVWVSSRSARPQKTNRQKCDQFVIGPERTRDPPGADSTPEAYIE